MSLYNLCEALFLLSVRCNVMSEKEISLILYERLCINC